MRVKLENGDWVRELSKWEVFQERLNIPSLLLGANSMAAMLCTIRYLNGGNDLVLFAAIINTVGVIAVWYTHFRKYR